MNLFSVRSLYTRFTAISVLLLIILFAALAWNSYLSDQALVVKGAVDNARIISRQIVETRDYLSAHRAMGTDGSGAFIPQVAASRIAEQITRDTKYYVRQVSLRYRNPANRPDSFETEMLKHLASGSIAEIQQVASIGEKKALRYLLPMLAKESCLVCHGTFETAPLFVQQRFPEGHFSYGYRVGDVIGAISVSVPMNDLYYDIKANIRYDLLYDAVALLLFMAITGLVMQRMIVKPVKAVSGGITEVARTGNFTQHLEQNSRDEVGELVRAFNELIAELNHKTIQRRESEERYRNFIEIAQSPIVTFMGDGKIVITNQKAEKLFGITKEELLGQCLFDFFEMGDEVINSVATYFNEEKGDLIGVTSRQQVRDVCGKITPVDMVISVSQSDQNALFSAILRPLKQ